MKPVYQTEFGAGRGNCLSACLASLLEWELEAIPNFSDYGGRFWPEFWQWMKERNLGMIGISNVPSGYHLIRVKSSRFEGSHHSLVGLNGKPIHDPYPGGNCEGELVWYDLVYLLDPTKPINRPSK